MNHRYVYPPHHQLKSKKDQILLVKAPKKQPRSYLRVLYSVEQNSTVNAKFHWQPPPETTNIFLRQGGLPPPPPPSLRPLRDADGGWHCCSFCTSLCSVASLCLMYVPGTHSLGTNGCEFWKSSKRRMPFFVYGSVVPEKTASTTTAAHCLLVYWFLLGSHAMILPFFGT